MHTITPEQGGFSAQRLERLNGCMQRYVDEGKSAGILTLIARRGAVLHLEAHGMRDIAAGKAMQPDTLFRIYSMTKPITSVAVMMLMEEGLLRLNDAVETYIPCFKDSLVYTPRKAVDFDLLPLQRPITIHDLLTHTSGLSYGFDPHSHIDELYRQQIWQRLEDEPELPLAKQVEVIAALPLAHQPGSAFRYSVATDVLGYLVEVISGRPFDVFLKERIFEPLGMGDTAFCVPPEKYDRLSAVYGPAEDGGLKQIEAAYPNRFTLSGRAPSGGGGLVSSIGDYLRFAQMLLNHGELDGVRLLGRKTVEYMTCNHLPPGHYPFDDPTYGLGLGGYVVIDLGRSATLGSLGNFGWGGAAATKFWVDYREQMVAILMQQFMPDNTYPIQADFTNLVYQAMEA